MGLQPSDPFSPHIEAVARHFWGDPNKHLSSRGELRWGSHGSRSIDLEKGTFFDHEANEGGGVLALVKREERLDGREAVQFLRERLALPIEELPSPEPTARKRIVATYDYADENGDLLFQTVRFEPKTFSQRRPARPDDPPDKVRDGWVWSVKGVRQVPYRLPDLTEALAMGKPVCIVEGEKDADALWALGIPATCNAMGAGKWPDTLNDIFAGAVVTIIPDNDDAGRAHRDLVGAALKPVAAEVRVLELAGLPLKGDVSDWLEIGSGDQLVSLLDTAVRPWGSGPPASRFGAIAWLDLSAPVQEEDWLTEGLVYPGDIGLFFGDSQAGKTFLGIEHSMAIARGTEFFGMACRQGAVVYQAGEAPKGVRRRLLAYGIHNRVATTDLPLVLLTNRVNLFDPEWDEAGFIAEMKAWASWLAQPLAMITFDTFSAATTGAEENASKDISRILDRGKRIRDATGAAINFIHHKNAGGQKHRGHTSIYADADFAVDVNIEEETKDRYFIIRKVKDGESGKRHDFMLQRVELESRDDGKTPRTSCVVVPAQDEPDRAGDKSKRAPLTSAQVMFLRALQAALVDRGGIAPPNVPTENSYVRVVEWQDFKRHYGSMGDPDRSEEAIKKALLRDGDALMKRRLIGRHKPYIWLTDEGRRSC